MTPMAIKMPKTSLRGIKLEDLSVDFILSFRILCRQMTFTLLPAILTFETKECVKNYITHTFVRRQVQRNCQLNLDTAALQLSG